MAWWFIWYLGRCYAFALGTVILLVGVALQAAATSFAMLIVGRIISGIATAMYAPQHSSLPLFELTTYSGPLTV